MTAPTKGDALTYFFSGGDLFFNAGGRGVYITPAMAQSLRDIHEDEARAAWMARGVKEARRSAKLYIELTGALTAMAEWDRVTGHRRAP